MTQPADRTDTGRSAGAGLGVRFFGILVSPRATYERVAADPNWIGILVLSLGCVAATTTVFLSTEVGQRAVLEQQIQGMQNFGMTVTDDVYARLEENAPNAVYFALANLAGGGGADRLRRALRCALCGAVRVPGRQGNLHPGLRVAHAGVVFVVQQCFVAPLNYVRESMSNPATLAAFVPMLEPGLFVVRILNVIDVFFVWWVIVLSIGLAVISERRTAPIAITLYAAYGGLAVVVALVLTRRAG